MIYSFDEYKVQKKMYLKYKIWNNVNAFVTFNQFNASLLNKIHN